MAVEALEIKTEEQAAGLYNEYWGYCYNLAFDIVKNRQDAEEVAQDVFCRIFRARNGARYTGRNGAKISTWIYRIARNTAKNRYRDNKIRIIGTNKANTPSSYEEPDTQRAIEESMLDEQSSLAVCMLNELQSDLGRDLEQLPYIYREAFVLRNAEQMSYQDIARLLNCDVGTIKSRIARARIQLKKAVGL
jgi:RNA polymerase sigma-70 factor (ECF subfamily)